MEPSDFDLYQLFKHHLDLSGDKDLNIPTFFETVGKDVNYFFEEITNKHNELVLYLHFEGSNSVTDWIRNFLFTKVPYKNMSFEFKVHKGFLEAFKEVKDIIFDKIMTATSNSQYKYNKIVVVGYSHGGGLAILAHELINFYRPDLKDNLITIAYEPPRVVSNVPREIENRWSNCYIIRNANDIVTHMPPALFGYRHVGNILQIGDKKKLKKYKLYPSFIRAHFSYEVEYSLIAYEREKKYE